LKVTQQQEAARQQVIEIELDDDDLEPYLNRAYHRLVQKANIPGFRKGKAPRSIIERAFGREYLINDVIEYMVSDVTSKAIEESDIDAGGLPRIDLKGLDPVQIEATIPLSPTVELNDYSTLRVERETTVVTGEQVDERLEQIREGLATWEPVERATKIGDMITADIEATVDGNVLMDQKSGVLVLEDEHDTVLPGLSKKLTRITKGKPKKFTLTIPDDYQSTAEGESVAGKEASFTATVSEIKERIIPDLDDEFAKGVGEGHDDLAALRQSIQDDLETEAVRNDDATYREAALAALTESADLEIPELLIDHEIDHIIGDREQALQRMNVGLEDYLRYAGKTREEFREEAREASLERLNRTYVLQSLVEAEAIEVSDDELTEKLESLRSTVPAEQAGQVDLDSDEAVASMRRNLQFENAVERLVAIVGAEAPITKKTASAKTTTGKKPASKTTQKTKGQQE
jgi:trigger factor